MQFCEKKPEMKPLRVLIIDDEVAYADVLKRRMEKRNFEVEVAHSGTEAIQKLRRASFDVAVLDLKMEDMNGIEVLKIFKKMDPEMPVIMITGHGSEQAAQEGMSCGAYDYLMKPCEFEVLIEKIHEAVKRSS
ncbi:MAG: response regulator [Thermodesulforhabdaceae bacterium]|jgi:DNA-binding NtrC family response regulator